MRRLLRHSLALCIAIAGIQPALLRAADNPAKEQTAIDIGSRRELFVDDYLVERVTGSAALQLHHPEPHEIVLTHDEPWEGTGSGYHSIFKDGNLYRMFYKAWDIRFKDGKIAKEGDPATHSLFCCYAESDDGIHWRKPKLGLHEFEGSKENNIVLASGTLGAVNVDAGHPGVFKDENPAAAPDARYKGIFRAVRPNGLLALKSPDGMHWTPMADKPVITKGAFDSQNLAFWDGVRGEYRAYWRSWSGGDPTDNTWKPSGVRAIRTAVSKDFVTWTTLADVTYFDSPDEDLYTSQVKPYPRAPHILIGFPTRYTDHSWTDSTKALPQLEHREMRAQSSKRYGTAITEGLFMASRDGVKFKRWNEAFLRPGIERDGTWNYGHQYIAWHPIATKSAIEGAPDELSLFATEHYWIGKGSALRRYTLRMDGFVSVNAPMRGGELVTKPLKFTGGKLSLNFSSSAAGGIKVEIQDESGKAIPGFALTDSQTVYGDSLDRTVTWKNGADVSALAGKTVRLRFELRDADLFALQFQPKP